MKVLLLDVNYKYGSTGKLIYSLQTYLNQNGYEAIAAYGRGPLVSSDNVYKFASNLETEVHALLTRITGFTGCFSPCSTKKLLSIIEDEKPDVIHINELHGYFVNYIQLLRYISNKGIPVVWTFHCEFMYTGRCGIAGECDKYLSGCGECKHLSKYPSTLFFDFSKKMLQQKKNIMAALDKIIICSPSKWLDSRVASSYLKDKKHCVIYNGIDTNIFCKRIDSYKLKQELGIENKKVVLSVASDLLKRTGTYIFQLAEKLPHIIFIMVGVNKDIADLPKNVLTFETTKDQDWLAKMYSLADLYLICSQRETFSMPCAEALCCGTPIVGFKAGAPELTFEGPYGKFCEYGDVEGLVSLIGHEIDAPVDSEKCINYANLQFSENSMCKSYLKLYSEILEGGV